MNQPVIIECDQMEDGDRIWFPSKFEAEQAADNGCCAIKPAPANYDGPRYYSEGDDA